MTGNRPPEAWLSKPPGPAIFARWLHGLALALWLGGLVVLGALVAPTAFHLMRINPALAANKPLQAVLAGGIVGESLRRFNWLCLGCGLALLAANGLLLRAGRLPRTGRAVILVCLGLAGVLLLVTCYLAFGLFPALDLAQGQGNLPLFNTLHRRYEQVSGMEIPALCLLAWLAAARDTHVESGAAERPKVG